MTARILRSALFTLALSIAALAAAGAARAADTPQDLMDRGRWREVRALAETRAKANPNDAEAQWLLSLALGVYGDWDGALDAAGQAVKLAPNNADYHERVAEVAGRMAQHANPFRQMGLAKRVKKEAEAALALDPRQWDAREVLMNFHLEAPGIVGGDRKRAASLVEEAEKLDPLHGHLLRAAYATQLKDSVATERELRAAAALAPTSYDAVESLASWFMWHRRWAEAETQARAVIALDPRRPRGYILLTVTYAYQHRTRDVDAALAEFEQALPDRRDAHYQAARVFITEQYDFPSAERWMRAYLTVEPEGGQPDPAHAHFRLGQAIAGQGRNSDAAAEFQLALKLDPKLDEAKKELKKLG